MRYAMLSASLVLSFASLPAAAQTIPLSDDQNLAQEAETVPEIVVTAREALTRDEARTFAYEVSAPVNRQIARLSVAACPKAIGFPPHVAARIEARIRAVATQVKAPVVRGGCRGNLIVIGADNGRDMMQAMQKLPSHLIRGLTTRELNRLTALEAPARAWSFTELQNEDGVSPMRTGGNGVPTMEVRRASHISATTQQAIGMAVVVLEWPAMLGKSPTQIADYVAMRTLAITRPVAAHTKAGTILTLFEPNHSPPLAMTTTDLAYLRSLYAQPTTRYVHTQIADIAREVQRASR